MEYPKTLEDIKTGRQSLDGWLEKNYEEFYNFLNRKYDHWSIKAELYMFYHNIDEVPTCPICGKQTNFHGYKYGFSKYCSSVCAQHDKETREKIKQTCLDKYGDDYYKQFSNKGKQTKLDRYGDANYNNIEKTKQTCIDRYGVENPMQSEKIREKSKQTCIERYGVPYSLLREDYKKEARKRFDKQIMDHYDDVISNNNGILICRCPDPQCNKCQEKQYEISYSNYWERRFKYNICPCIKKIPLGESVTCNKNTSIEKFIQNLLDRNNIIYNTNVKGVIGKKELDIYIPNKHIAIECNGCYWHSNKDKQYHYNKFKACQEKNIQLLTIWEDQIINKPDIVKSIILSKLGIYKERIYARKCKIREVPSKESSEFINNNHLQGNVNASIRLGLYYKDELVSIMTFGKKRNCMNMKNGYELYRYCNKLNTQVVGGASRLFKYFLKTYNINTVDSFSSNDISDGSLYNILGFRTESTSISYWYIKNKHRYHRYQFRKDILVKKGYDKNKTEFQIMDELGYLRIWDTGQTKWIYEK